MVSLNVTVLGEEQVNARIDRFVNQVKDWRIVWEDVEDEFWNIEKDQFDTQGHGGWEPLSPRYAAWKAVHYPGQPLLVLSGELRSAVTGGAGRFVRREPMQMALGWQGVPYWRFHQTGTRNMPQRKVVDLTGAGRTRLLRALHRGMINALGRLHK